MTISIREFSTTAHFDGVANKARMQRAQAKTASFVHGVPGDPPRELVTDIAKRILDEFHAGTTIAMVKGPSRLPHLVRARRHVWAVVHAERPDLSVSTIARLFKRDHTTVLHGIRRYWEIDHREGK